MYVESLQGEVLIFLSETESSGIMLSPRAGDVLVPPLTILTGTDGRISVQVDGYQLEIATGSSIVIPGRTRFGILETAGPAHQNLAGIRNTAYQAPSRARLAWTSAPQ